MCSFPDLVILERSLTVAAQCFGAAIHDALHMIYTGRVVVVLFQFDATGSNLRLNKSGNFL